MSAIHSAKKISELALRAINAFPISESSADEGHLREAMTWLDMIMAEFAGSTRVFFLVPETKTFALTNGLTSYDLNASLSMDLPMDEMQFPVEAFLIKPFGQSVVNIGAAIPGSVTVGLGITDITNPSAIPPGATVAAINSGTQQLTLSTPSMVALGDVLQVASVSPTNLTTSGALGGTVNNPGMTAGVTRFTRHPIKLVPRDEFNATRIPEQFGAPRIGYIDRVTKPTLSIFPTPAASDPQMHLFGLDIQKYAPNVAPQGNTGAIPQASLHTHFRQAWQRWLVFQLASDLGSGPIFKIADASIKTFQAKADVARISLLAFENREHDTAPPVCEAYDGAEYGSGGVWGDHDSYIIRV